MSVIPPCLAAALADRYRLERELGQGGMATVYLAEDLKHKRRVALKLLKPELAAVLGAERFIQEITTTAALQHPHILPLFDSGSADGFLYYVMPFIDGETLRARLKRETQLGIDDAVKITTEVADALDYAHRRGVIHRDIKPENILLHGGHALVADFGIALAVSAAAGGRMTETGLSLGTPHYMSPEQATAEKELTNRSDIYSLGSVLYEMLTGNPPHTGASAQQIIMRIVTEDAAPVTGLRKSVPPNVAAAATAMALEKLPADRFESARAFAGALRNPGFAVAEIPRAGVAASVGPRSRTNLGLAGLATAAFALAAWGWLRPRPERRERDSWRVALPVPDSVGISGTPSLSADGTTIAYVGGDNRAGLYRVIGGDAAAPELLFSTGRDNWPIWPSASADGPTIFYTLRSAGHLRVFAHHLGDSAAADRDIFATRDNTSQAVPSPDGRWLAYLTDESGRTELSVRPANLARAERWKVPRPGGAGARDPTSHRWSRDSREIVYRSGNRMVSARVAPGPSFTVTEQHGLFPAPDYEPSFDLLPNGDLLMIRKRPITETPLQLIMIDRWNSGIR